MGSSAGTQFTARHSPSHATTRRSRYDRYPATVRRVGIDELPALLGQTLGPSAPLLITQDRIDEFAAATGDQQWLHVDPGRAAAGPFGITIAHGYLTLSPFTTMLWSLLEVPDAAQVINYGLGEVRFPASVPAGCELSLTARVDGSPRSPTGTSSRSPGHLRATEPTGPPASSRRYSATACRVQQHCWTRTR